MDRDRKWQYDGFMQTAYEAIVELDEKLEAHARLLDKFNTVASKSAEAVFALDKRILAIEDALTGGEMSRLRGIRKA